MAAGGPEGAGRAAGGAGFVLLLMRHGEAAGAAGSADRDRPLTERGREQTRRVAEAALSSGLRPARVLASPARRARETAEAWLAAAGGGAEPATDEAIYNAGPEDLFECIRAQAESLPSLLVVGHAPGIPELALALAREREALDRRLGGRFPAATLVALAFPGAGPRAVRPGAGEVRAVLPAGS